jgi:hypothetical protein
MRCVLHILTRPDERLARKVVFSQEEDSENTVVVADLTQPAPDYRDLLEKIFAADSVQTW